MRRKPTHFIVALSFLMGIVTTIVAYQLRNDRPASPREVADQTAQRAKTSQRADTPQRGGQQTPPTPQRVDAMRAASTGAASDAAVVQMLRARKLEIPVAGVDADLRDTYPEARGSRSHEALDILAPRNTKVRAVEHGRIEKLFTSKAGGLTIYEFDPTEAFAYYYAHLDRYADGLREGQIVKRGDVIGYVGSTGNASPDAPHLHFAIFRLGPERQWWKGEAINPYLALTRR
jgi:murein DD-endopeptidase MepM/ murein hydrolase activator NlpD